MKTSINLIQENMHNLTSLWQSVNQKLKVHRAGKYYDYGFIQDSQWPNRLWLHQEASPELLDQIKRQLGDILPQLLIPQLLIEQLSENEIFEKAGFEKIFEQVGMSLVLKDKYWLESTIHFQRVNQRTEAMLWESLFKWSFGYLINHAVILQLAKSIDFRIVYHQDTPIGTVILYPTDQIMGIHCLGIISEHRRKGFAEQIMKLALNEAIQNGFQYATLQASAMGKGLYLKLGFEEEFLLRNYLLKV